MKSWNHHVGAQYLDDAVRSYSGARLNVVRPERADGNSVGVTGGTGWLGRHIIRKALRSGMQVVAVARGREDAHRRIWNALTCTPDLMLEAQNAGWSERLIVAPVERWSDALPVYSVGQVFHAAANTSWLQAFPEALQEHVDGVRWSLAWANASQADRLDLISTLSVWVASDRPEGRCYEDDDLMLSARLWGTYAAAKWAGDRWLEKHQNAWMGVTARHRLGLLLFSKDEGWPAASPITDILQATQRWGWPARRQTNLAFDWSPTDEVVADLWATTRQHAGGVFQHAADEPMEMLAQWPEATGAIWPERDPLAVRARRAMGRWLAQPNSHPWWADVGQADRHTFDRSRAIMAGGHGWRAPDVWDWMDLPSGQ